jgi:predicted ribosomally synthesized peptide with SipW-like signal peptide
MKKKKSLVAIVAVLLVVVVGATFAYFTSSATFNNQFNLGNYSITTQEVFTSPDNWAPGDTTPKILTATNNGSIDAAVRVSYTEEWTDDNGDPVDSSNIPNDAVTINFTTPSDWTESNGYYYYNYILKAGNTTSSLIESVSLNSNLNNSNCTESNGVKTCTSNLQGLAGYHYTLTFTIETVQYDQYRSAWNTNQSIVEKPLIQIMNSQRTKDTLQVGDEICINGDTTECFNFYGYDGNNIKMLAEWNLNVGSNAKGTATNLQDSDVKGYVSSGTKYGNVTFSGTNYWYDGSALKSKYGSSYPADVYDTDYIDASGNNYSVAYYVENYKNVLETYGLNVQSARLLTYSEATTNVGCSGSSCPTNGFITNTSFWLGSAGSDFGVWFVLPYGYFSGDSYFGNVSDFGVRPVIVISKSDI